MNQQIITSYSPPSERIPVPEIAVKQADEILEKVATHLNNNPDSDYSDTTASELKQEYEYPILASSQPLFAKIKLSSPDSEFDSEQDLDILLRAISHETLHIVLLQLEDKEASVKLDNLSNIL